MHLGFMDVFKMSRRRLTNPTKAISITLKQSSLDEIDDRLPLTSSRSALIQRAVTRYLNGDGARPLQEWSIGGIINHLIYSRELNETQLDMLKLFSKSL